MRAMLVGSAPPRVVALLDAFSGLCFGISEWIGMVIGCTRAGFVLTFVMSIVGRASHAASLLLNVNADAVEGNQDVDSEDWTWDEVGEDWIVDAFACSPSSSSPPPSSTVKPGWISTSVNG